MHRTKAGYRPEPRKRARRLSRSIPWINQRAIAFHLLSIYG
ncbi:hypothetical protein [Coleofasciculus sp. H7-2]